MSSWKDFSSKIKSASSSSASKNASKSSEPSDNTERKDEERWQKLDKKKGRQRQYGHSSVANDLVDVIGKRDRKLPAHLRPASDVTLRSAKFDDDRRQSSDNKQKSNSKNQTTSSWASTPSSQLEDVRANLARKAKLYDQLRQGKTGGLTEEKLQDSLVDWNRKEMERQARGASEDSDDASDDSKTGSSGLRLQEAAEDQDDPLTEYEDDLGRMRRVRRSEVPREAMRAKMKKDEEAFDENMIIYGPSTSFPVYTPDPTRRAEDRSSTSGYKRAAPDHFDASFEKRYRGAGFFQFSQDDETRRRQMESLRQERTETAHARNGEHPGVKSNGPAPDKKSN